MVARRLARDDSPSSDVEHDRDRTVVDEVYEHVRAEASMLDRDSMSLDGIGKGRKYGSGGLRIGCRGERWSPSLPDLGEECELGDEEHRSPGAGKAHIHLPIAVGEDPHADDLRCSRPRIALIVAFGHTDEGEQTGLNLSGGASVDMDGGSVDPL